MSVNKVFILGNIGRDPEVTTANSGLKICKLSVATTEKVKDEKKTEWHRVTAFGRTAETIGLYFHKGDQIHIEGRLSTNKWQDKDGNDRYTTEIICDRFSFSGMSGVSNQERLFPEPESDQKNHESDDIPF